MEQSILASGTEDVYKRQVIFDAHFLHELETSIHFVLGSLQFIGISVPGEMLRSTAELVATLCTECMPPLSLIHIYTIVAMACRVKNQPRV